MDTICALSSAPGRAGVAVIRVSGPDSFAIVRRLVGELPEPGSYALRPVRGVDGNLIDRALVLAFAGPASFTGEDVVEVQGHGGPAVVAAVLDALIGLGARPAEAGEFTRRALENEKLTLTDVEGLSDLLAAETRVQLDQAQRVLSGRLGDVVEVLRGKLLRAVALVEASIDFADEDVPEDVLPEVMQLISDVREVIAKEIEGSFVAERVRDGFEVAVVGPPNSGKSTLLNALAGRDAALVSDIPGTTRDVVEVQMDLRGLPITWLDTAGVRDTDDIVERMGVDRALERAKAADLRVFLLDGPRSAPSFLPQEGDLVLVGKSDIQPGNISGRTGFGLENMLSRVFEVLSARVARVGVAMNGRHRLAFLDAERFLGQGVALAGSGVVEEDLLAEELRMAIRRLEVLIGRIDVEAVLGEIFGSFCIGK